MRSGTTIAGQLLASSPSTVLVGELRPLLVEPHRHEECDCGHRRDECPFWSQVYSSVNPDELAAATAQTYALSTLARIAAARLRGRRLPEDVQRVGRFLRSVRAAAGDQVIVDTSKTPMGVLLWQLAGERVHIALCVRGVWKVAKAQADPGADTGLAPQPLMRSALVWAAYNGMSLLARAFAESLKVITFGRLRREPRRVAEPIWHRAGAQPSTDLGPTFHYEQSHVLAGNPRRARGRSVTITARG